jgi:TP901 family phage tail tape measure protein
MSQELGLSIVISAVDAASKDIEAVNRKVKELREELDRSEFSRAGDGIQRIGQAARDATQPMANAAKSGLAFAGALTAIATALAGKLYQSAVSYEGALLDLGKVLDGGRAQAEQYGEQLNKLAEGYAQNGQELLASMTNFVQAGYRADEAFRLVSESVKLMIAGDLEAGEASRNLISILKGFDAPASEAAHAVDALNAVSNSYATNVKQLSDGMAALSPVAKQMGFTLDETAGLLTPVIEVYQSGAEAADALKVGLLKLTEDTKPVQDALAQIGVSQRDLNGQLRSGKDIFLDVARAFQTLSDIEKLDLTQRLVGLEQAGRMSTVLGNLGKVMEVTATAANSAGSAFKEVQTRLQSAQADIDRANERFRQLAVTLGNQFKTEITGVVDATGQLAKAFDDAVKGGALDPLLAALRPQVAAIGTLFEAMAEHLEEALNGLDWTPLVTAIGDLSGEFGEAFRQLTAGMDLTTVDGLRTLLQSLINVLAKFTAYIAGVVDGLGPLFGALRTFFGLISGENTTLSRLVGEMHGLALSVNTLAPAISALGSAFMGTLGTVVEWTAKILLAAVALRLLAASGVPVAAILARLATLIGGLSPALAGALAAISGLSGAVVALGVAATAGGFAFGLLINKFWGWVGELIEAKTGLDLFSTAQERAQKSADWSNNRLGDKLREISQATGVTVTSMKELEAAVRSGALVQDAASGAWSKGNAELKRQQAEAKGAAAASQLLSDRAAQQAQITESLAAAYRAQGLEYDARTGAVTRATQAEQALGQAMSAEAQLAAQGIEVLEFRNDQLYRLTGTTSGAAAAQAKLAAAIQQGAAADAQAYAAALSELSNRQAEVINAADAEAVRRVTIARELGQDLAGIEAEIAATKKRSLSQILRDYQAHIASLNAAARSHLDEVKRIEDEIAALKLSTEDRLRALRQRGMSDYQAYQDQQSQIAEKGAQARAALEAGEFERASTLYEEQAALAERAARAVRDGDKEIVSEQKAVATAVDQVAQAMAGKEQALQAMADSHRARADAANAALQATEAAAQGAASQIAALDGADTASQHTIDANIDAVLREIDQLNGRDTSSTHTIRVVEQRAVGGLIGLHSGGPVFPRPAWSRVPGLGNEDTVPAALPTGAYVLRQAAARYYGPLLQRLASGGLVNTLLTPGERWFKPATVARHGQGLFDALNHLAIPREQLAAALHGFTAPAARFAAGGLVGAASAATGARDQVDINLQIGARPVRLQGARDQAQALASALKELQRGL